MKKNIIYYSFILFIMFSLCGCSSIGAKSASVVFIYITTTIASLLLLIAYCTLFQKNEPWFLLLFASVFIVNIGYLSLSISKTLEEALLANRISYLGSVLLPMSMLMIILKLTHFRSVNWLPGILLGIGIFIFIVAASPGYLNIYYKEVALETINGVSSLNKVYGPWHCLYLFYLLTYFLAMIMIIIYTTIKAKIDSVIQAVILIIAVFVNLGVWFIEQLTCINFEFLSVSYIISELFLLGLYIIMEENQKLKDMIMEHEKANPDNFQKDVVIIKDNEEKTEDLSTSSENKTDLPDEVSERFVKNLTTLTKTERMIFELYTSGNTTKEILNKMNITENTLKFHNKNIYSKLEVSSRKQLLSIYHKSLHFMNQQQESETKPQ